MHASVDRPLPSPRSTLDLAFAFGRGRAPGREAAFLVLALAVHGAVTFAVRAAPVAVVEAPKVTEVELPPPPPPEPEKVTPPPEPPKDEAVPAAKPSSAPPPQAARAGALVTAKDDRPSAKNEELVDFVTDPNGTSYGSGVVARGGTADHGERGATVKGVGSAPAPVVSAPPSDGLVAAANLSRRATLNEANACAGYYPSEADADSGAVTLTLVVRADGAVTSAAVLSETPAGQGFGKAARACLQNKRFEPSLDREGKAVAAATTIKVRFVR